MKYLIANWKAEMNHDTIESFLSQFDQLLAQNPDIQASLHAKLLSIIICPPFPYLSRVSKSMAPYSIQTGSQTVSTQPHGKYTGEVTAEALRGLVTHAIIGHSERRTHFGETNEDIEQKLQQCTDNSIVPILCIRNELDTVFQKATLVAYEPVEAIGSGKNENPRDVVAMKKKLALPQESVFIYGGSVDENNMEDYIKTGEIQGFLVGTASLHADQFFKLATALL